MKASIKTKATLAAFVIVLLTTIIAASGASLLHIRQTRRGNADRLQKAMGSITRQLREQFDELTTTYHLFATDPQNNYFFYISIKTDYFLWQDNFTLLRLVEQLQLDRMAFYYGMASGPSPGQLRMFYEKAGHFIQLDGNGKQNAIEINDFGAPDAQILPEPLTPPFPETYHPSTSFSLQKQRDQFLLISHVELRRLSNTKENGDLLGYFIFEQPILLDIPLLNQELGVQVTLYDHQGHIGLGHIPLPSQEQPSPMRVEDGLLTLTDTQGQPYDALVAPFEFQGKTVGMISVSISQAETRRKIMETVGLLSLLGVALLLPLSILVRVLVARLTQPIITLTRISAEMAEGKLTHTIHAHQQDELGILAGSFSRMRDEIQKKQEALANERNLLRTLIDTLPDMIYVKDVQGGFILVNQALIRSMGKTTPDDLLGKTDFDFSSREEANAFYQDEQRILSTRQPLLGYEEPKHDPFTGEKKWMLTSKVPFYNNREQIAGLVGISRDITRMKDAEDTLRQWAETLEIRVQERTAELARQKYILDTFMANVPDSIYFKDRECRFIQVNAALAKSVGVDDPAQLIGKTDFDLFPEALARSTYADEQQILQTGEPKLSVEEADPRGYWLLTSKMPLRDEKNELIGTFGISRDITPLKRAQQQIEQLNEQLKQENLRMGAELDVARRLQQMVLPMPHELTAIPGLEIVGYMQPAEEVGGDYYDVLSTALPGGISIGIGDVTGHGLESGVLMLMTQTAIRTLIDRGETDPVIFLNTLNRVLFHNIQRMGVDRSLTLAMVNYQDGQLRLIGQHEEALVVRADGRIERMDTINLGFPLGMVSDIRQWVAEATVTLAPGDGLVLYTDGITEAQSATNHFYGIERLCAVISANWHGSADEVKEAIVEDVRAFIGDAQVYDDVTLVVLKQQ